MRLRSRPLRDRPETRVGRRRKRTHSVRQLAPGVGRVAGLAAALVLASLLLAYQQYQRASELGTEVEGLRSALETARGELGSYRERMTLVKGHIDDLSARVGALAELIDDDGAPVSSFGSEAEAPSE